MLSPVNAIFLYEYNEYLASSQYWICSYAFPAVYGLILIVTDPHDKIYKSIYNSYQIICLPSEGLGI